MPDSNSDPNQSDESPPHTLTARISSYLLATAFFGLVITLVVQCLIPWNYRDPENDRRRRCSHNLRCIGMGLLNYHEAYGTLPPAYIVDSNERPMHSWRVRIVSYLDSTPLDPQWYHYDEPWNGPHNGQLAETVVPIFNCPSGLKKSGLKGSVDTNYVAVVGPNTAWPETKSVTFRDFTDGVSNTIVVVEIANSGIHWMEPRDLHVLQMAATINPKSGMGISSPHAGGAHVLMGDGAVRFVSEKTSPEVIHALLTIDGGEKVSW